ncbi:MAG TPA: hypothetical protein DHW17_09115 [Nitrospina sp.]|nr:hypothetical protein [Nitrospina sp.]
MVARNTAFPEKKLCSTNLSVIGRESSAQPDPMLDPKCMKDRSQNTRGKETPQMRPKVPIVFSRMQ